MAKKKRTSSIEAEVVNLDAIAFDPNNYRLHPQNNLDLISDSIKDLGFARSIVIDENNMLIAGEGATRGSVNAGLKEALIIDAEGNQVVAVRRKNLTPEQKERLKIIDNRSNELSEWNFERLQTFLLEANQNNNFVSASIGFSDDELRSLLNANYIQRELTEDEQTKLESIVDTFNTITLHFTAEQAQTLRIFQLRYLNGESLEEKIVNFIAEHLKK